MTRSILLPILILSITVAHASTDDVASDVTKGNDLVAHKQVGAAADAVAGLFGRPTFGVRLGGGNWKEFVLDGGVDVTLKLPVLPLPALRFDAEAWAKPGNFSDRHGQNIAVLGMQSFALAYAGVGPSYYFTDNLGSHRSGIGAKALVGLSLPSSTFVEAGIIFGPSSAPVFFSVGRRF